MYWVYFQVLLVHGSHAAEEWERMYLSPLLQKLPCLQGCSEGITQKNLHNPPKLSVLGSTQTIE